MRMCVKGSSRLKRIPFECDSVTFAHCTVIKLSKQQWGAADHGETLRAVVKWLLSVNGGYVP